MMSHDKIKAAARRRMAATGEPYAAARRQAVTEHGGAACTSAVSAEDLRAAAAAHRELGPEYSDAVVASLIESVDRAVAARVEARLADRRRPRPAKLTRWGRRLLTRRVARDVLAASAGALVVVGAVGVHDMTSPHPGHAASSAPVVHFGPLPAAGQAWRQRLGQTSEVRHFTVVAPSLPPTRR